MYYCTDCAVEHGWPTVFFLPRSLGPCEVCDRIAVCHDVPTTWLAGVGPKDAGSGQNDRRASMGLRQ